MEGEDEHAGVGEVSKSRGSQGSSAGFLWLRLCHRSAVRPRAGAARMALAGTSPWCWRTVHLSKAAEPARRKAQGLLFPHYPIGQTHMWGGHRALISWFTPQMPQQSELGQAKARSWEPEVRSWSPASGAGAQPLESSPAVPRAREQEAGWGHSRDVRPGSGPAWTPQATPQPQSQTPTPRPAGGHEFRDAGSLGATGWGEIAGDS